MKSLLFFFSIFVATTLSAAAPQQITFNNYNQIINSSSNVVIDIYTDWCGPCKSLAPIFQAVAEQYGNKYTFGKLNGDQEKNLVSTFGITGYPTIIFIKNGQVVGRHVGFIDQSQLVNQFNVYFQ